MSRWPAVALGEVLSHRKDFIVLDDNQRYKRCRVQLHAKGIVLRDALLGLDIKTKRQQVCKTGEFLVAEIDAKMGGFGMVPDFLDGAIVSSHYFLFEADDANLDKKFLDYFCRSENFRGQVEAQGSTNYASIRPADVLGYKIQLPPLTEQQTIVARLDQLAEKVRQVNEHLDAVETDADNLLAVQFREAIKNAPLRKISEIAPAVRRSVQIDISTRYREIGARSFGKGLFVKPDFDGAEATWQKPVWIEEGDLVLSNIKAWEGAIAIAGKQHSGCIASHRYITCVPDVNYATAAFLAYFLLSPDGLEKVGFASPGTADRNRTLSLTNLGKIEVPLPPLNIQREFNLLQTKIATLKAKHAKIREANQALIPATLERIFSSEGHQHG